ncbi:tryptophan transporter [Desulforamulus putei]|uniref:Tryptophan transporter TrpP n=1 Tax=Desulforamulus putei DSM 12395 TaxID=1121429 RepID=A0A1M4Y7Q1_9FIRM|nr:tryptophan transporter [Desulforamulus putei]SHF01844.1 Tryptophan transporter TrpP [Desulforamulus putei DSM 12395]
MSNPVVEQVIIGKMSKTKEIAVVAFLIAIGAVLRMFSPAILGITPNFVIAMYCLAILLLRPRIGMALGIGIVAGAVSMIFSKSPIPYLNLATEPAGALVCALLASYLPEFSIKNYSFKPSLATLMGTLVSGGLYVVLNFRLALNLPVAAMQAAFVGVVIPVAVINMVIAQALYAPVKKFLYR